MTYEQFWDSDPWIARDYRLAHKIKLDEANQMAWLQGAYVYQAVGALAPALRAFSKGRVQEYMKEPIGFVAPENEPVDKKKASDNKAKQWLEMWAVNFNAKFDEKIAKGGEANGRDTGNPI